MANNKPHADNSSRAERRRLDKAVEKAHKIAQANPRVQPPVISMTDVLTKVGVLTVEIDYLRKQLNDLKMEKVEAAVEELKEEKEAEDLKAEEEVEELTEEEMEEEKKFALKNELT